MRQNDLVVSATQILLVSLVVFLSAYIFAKIIRLAFRWLRWSVQHAGSSAYTSFICFAIAVYLFPRPLTFIFSKGWDVAVALVTDLPQALLQLLPALQNNCANSPPAACINVVTSSVLATSNVFISSIFARLDVGNFPLVDAILMTAIWLGLANLSNWTSIGGHLTAAADTIGARLVHGYKAISPTSRTNFFFFAILALGSFLSVSSIIAIPSLLETETQERLKPEDLKKRLTDAASASDGFVRPLQKPVLKYGSSEVSGSQQVDVAEARQTQPTDDAGTAGIQLFILTTAKNSGRTIDELSGQWGDLRGTFNSRQIEMIEIATQTFDLSNRGRKGVRETQQHFLAVELWYRRWWTQQAAQLNQCRVAIESYASKAEGMLETLASINTLARTTAIPSSAFNDVLKRVNQSETDAKSTCAAKLEAQDVPAREDFGGYLGVFGFATRWLLKTESLPLVLITGLLGFGLLGAACSTFIRNVGARNAGEPLVPNLASVVIRGGSAAILVFLAVYGGLAVFASTNTSPNPYVVLFACLAAAVYSDDAWAWGAQQFKSRLTGQGSDQPTQDRTGGGKPGDESSAAPDRTSG